MKPNIRILLATLGLAALLFQAAPTPLWAQSSRL